ncbi:MAG: peptidylprolyl isomerase [Rikenellaceae bacterium]
MATLNTLRTRFGFVLTGVIALVLLAFIFSPNDFLAFSGSDPVVAKINGSDVTYSDYSREYENIYSQSGMSQPTDQQLDMIYRTTWQALVASRAIVPGVEQMGLSFGSSEYSAVIRGELPTQTMYSAFADPQSGAYSLASLNNFVLSSRGNADAEAAWSELIAQASEERVTTKYMALVLNGINANSLEGEMMANGENSLYTGKWALKRYSDVDDSQVSVSDAEVKAHYDSHKSLYKRDPSRSISYVVFNVTPSQDDLSQIESRAKELAGELASTPAEEIRAFLRENRIGTVGTSYLSEAQLPVAESAALVAGGVYGPRISGDVWRISRVASSVYASDTLSLRHIVLPYTAEVLADSLYEALKGGGDFAAAATEFSQYAESARNGGDIGAVPFASFSDEFSQPLASARKGDIVKIAVGDMIQILEVYDASPRKKQYKVATIELPIVASEATRLEAHNNAGVFAVSAADGSASFDNTAAASSVSPYKSVLTPSTRSVSSVSGSVDVVRWANKAKVGAVSEIFSVEDGYLVATVTNINDAEYESLSAMSEIIRMNLANDKKFELLSSTLSGSTFADQQANMEATTTGEFSGIGFNSYYIDGIGVEPSVIGAIAATTNTGVVSAPVKGRSGLYIFEVNSIEDAEEPQDVAGARLNIEAMTQQQVQQQLFSVLESLSDIEDMRSSIL